MPDFAMCRGDGCEKRDICWRHTAQPSQRQTYFTVVPMESETECEYFMPARLVGRGDADG